MKYSNACFLTDSALFWLTVITSISVLIAINIGGSSFFNP